MKKFLVAVALCTASLSFAGEEDLKPAQEEGKAKFDEAMEDPMKAMNEKCGTKVTYKTDFQNFKDSDWSGYAFYSWCADVPSTIAQMCSDRPAYKKVMAKKLAGINCFFGGVKPPEKKDGSNEGTLRNMSFEKGVFTFHMSKEASNVSDNVKATIEKALN